MKKTVILFCLVFLFCLNGCSTDPISHEFFAMDTVMKVTVYNENDRSLLAAAQQKVEALESLLSVTNQTSDIYKTNVAGTLSLSPDTTELLSLALALHKETNGLFDITVYPAVKAWGFTLDKNRVPSQEELATLLPLIGSDKIALQGNTLSLSKGTEIDLGGIAKGYAADKVAEQLQAAGCGGAVLSFGGNVKTIGQKPDGNLFQIAVQDPASQTNTLGTLSVAGNTAVVTSGDSQRYFEQDGVKYHHIIDPRTAAPANSDLSSVTVICQSATKADAYATALFIMGLEEGLKFVEEKADIEAVFVTKNKEIHLSTGAKKIFTP